MMDQRTRAETEYELCSPSLRLFKLTVMSGRSYSFPLCAVLLSDNERVLARSLKKRECLKLVERAGIMVEGMDRIASCHRGGFIGT